MKTGTIKFLIAISLIASAISCKNKNKISPQDAAKTQISKTWILDTGTAVALDGEDVTADYAGFEITFTATGTYNAQNGIPAFNANGTWSFAGESLTQINRDTDISTSIILTDNDLLMTFTLSESQLGSRTTALAGEYFFKLVKKN
jgi:hypothetical protein